MDAVATNPDPFTGGLCVIQAKRYKGVVDLEAVRALGAVVEDMRATRGFMVATSWYGASSEAYAKRNERITLVNGFHVKDQIKNTWPRRLDWHYQHAGQRQTQATRHAN